MAKTDAYAVFEVEYNSLVWEFPRKQMALDFISTMLNADGDAECIMRKKMVEGGGEHAE